jgi:hypothetical protein
MTLADDVIEDVYEGRSIAGEEGFRVHTVAIVVVTTPGPHTGDGVRVENVTPIVEANGQPPRVRWLKDDEIALGQLPLGSVEVGPITPLFAGGGTDTDLLNGANLSPGQVRLLRITGPNHPEGADYTIVGVKAERPLRRVITAKPAGSQT